MAASEIRFRAMSSMESDGKPLRVSLCVANLGEALSQVERDDAWGDPALRGNVLVRRRWVVEEEAKHSSRTLGCELCRQVDSVKKPSQTRQ